METTELQRAMPDVQLLNDSEYAEEETTKMNAAARTKEEQLEALRDRQNAIEEQYYDVRELSKALVTVFEEAPMYDWPEITAILDNHNLGLNSEVVYEAEALERYRCARLRSSPLSCRNA